MGSRLHEVGGGGLRRHCVIGVQRAGSRNLYVDRTVEPRRSRRVDANRLATGFAERRPLDRRFERFGSVVRDGEVRDETLAWTEGSSIGFETNHRRSVRVGESVDRGFLRPEVIEDAVELPLDVGELGENVAGDSIFEAHVGDNRRDRRERSVLPVGGEIVESVVDLAQCTRCETLLDAFGALQPREELVVEPVGIAVVVRPERR